MLTTKMRFVLTLYAIGLAVASLVGIAYAEDGAGCHATWQKTIFPNGAVVFALHCEPNDCPEACTVTGGGVANGPTWATCRCAGLIYCNAAVRNAFGWSSEEMCLGGCEQAAEELCPDLEGEPWTVVGIGPGGELTCQFECDCAPPA